MTPTETAERSEAQLEAGGSFAPSPAGPVPEEGFVPAMPPGMNLPAFVQTMRFGLRPLSFALRAQRDLGEVFTVQLLSQPERFAVTTHPDHVKSLFTAKPADAPSMTGESPLRPILGPNSVLTATGDRHMRQRKLLLRPFHGDAVRAYAEAIERAAHEEIDTWPVGEPFALAPRMQAITLDVIMAGIFGVEGKPAPGTIEDGLREGVRGMIGYTTKPWWQLVEVSNLQRTEPNRPLKYVLDQTDTHFYAAIEAGRARSEAERGADVLSLLLCATTESGERLTDLELRDELMTLVLAGHETTANQLAWIFERLLRTPRAYDRLRESVRAEDGDADGYVDAVIHEGMRARPVIPMVVRRVQTPWQLGDFRVPARTPVATSIVALHHRPDVYPEPLAFRPERFVGRKPGTYTWVPFGGGIRRCLGATLAMAEQRVVLEAVARRTDMVAPDQTPERARQRNVTMIPQHGGRVIVTALRDA